MKVEQGSVKSDLKNQQTGKSKTRHYKKRKGKKSNKVKCDKTKNNNKQTTKKTGHTKMVAPNVKRETHWWIKAYKQKYETVNVNTEELNTQEIN